MLVMRLIVSNLFTALFICLIFLTKRLLGERLSAKYHYYIWFLLLPSLGMVLVPSSVLRNFSAPAMLYEGIAASSGSACTSGSLDPSHVLLAIGLPHEVAHGSLRLSLSEYNTQEEVDYVLEELPKIVTYLRNMSPVWDELEKGEKKHVI